MMSEQEEIDLRRCKLFLIGEEDLLCLIRGQTKIIEGMPDDAVFLQVHYDHQYAGWMIRVHSLEFETVCSFQAIPMFHPVIAGLTNHTDIQIESTNKGGNNA